MTKKTKPTKVKNVYQKLQQARVDLQNKSLKKSGRNQSFSYYELGDFLSAINEINNNLGIMTRFNITNDRASLEIINCDNPKDKVCYFSPTAEVALPKAQAIQGLGAKITYMRRYLLMMAYEIVESDYVDRKKQSEVKELPEKYVKQIYGVNDLLKLNTLCKDIQKETKMKYQKSLLEIYTLKKEELTTKEENATS